MWDPYIKTTEGNENTPLATWQEGGPYTSLSVHRTGNVFAASSGQGCIRVWDLNQSSAPQTIQWPSFTDTITDVCFNQVETSIIGSVASDRSVILFDLRTNSKLNIFSFPGALSAHSHSSASYQDGPQVCRKPHRFQPNGSHEPGSSIRRSQPVFHPNDTLSLNQGTNLVPATSLMRETLIRLKTFTRATSLQ